jgi:hypothetical protein
VNNIRNVKFEREAAKFENQKHHDKKPQAKASLKFAPGLEPSPWADQLEVRSHSATLSLICKLQISAQVSRFRTSGSSALLQ